MSYDLVVIGGGINGCGCAADAAMRGLSVLLCEQDDLAAQTSSKSSKLIHGGLRYLEQYEFRLVRHALEEQQILMHIAPHLIHPLAFVLPYRSGLRPAWLLRCGLFIYNHLSRHNTLPHSKTLFRKKEPNYFKALQSDVQKGFLFYDAQTHDARLTITVALQAKAHGATILPRTRFVNAVAQDRHWHITLQSQDGSLQHIMAKAIINAGGPWASQIADHCQNPVDTTISYVKGSHIVVPAFYSGEHAYLLQAPDQRVIFVIPYYGQLLIGTTDFLVSDPQMKPDISTEEIEYLKKIIHSYFQHTITTITATWAGIRALPTQSHHDPAQLSRDCQFEVHHHPLPIVSILNGKLTTYRYLSEQIVDQLSSIFPNLPASKTSITPLPGADWQNAHFSDYEQHAHKKYAWLETPILTHYLQTYGSRTELLLEQCTQPSDLGLAFGPILRQKEVDFLRQHEWAQTAEDILWRRTQLGLNMEPQALVSLEAYLSQNPM
jgi:glycerol-3-phosphate dehydrogenase